MSTEQRSYTDNRVLIKTTIRMPKEDTSFFYFTMESNENISFYSTLPFEKGQAYRDIVVYTTPELESCFKNILAHLETRLSLEILSETEISDL